MLFFVMILVGVSFGAVWISRSVVTNTPDEALMQRIVQGDHTALAPLYRRHRIALYNYILYMAPDVRQAELLLQETFVRLVEQRPLSTELCARVHLYTIAHRLCRASTRHQRHHKDGLASLPLQEGVHDDHHLQQNDSCCTQESTTADEQAEQHSGLEQGLAALPRAQKEVFLLRQIAHLPYKEIARLVEIDERHVKHCMEHALCVLREHLQGSEPPGEENNALTRL